MPWILVGILTIIIIILAIKRGKKAILDRTEEARYIEKVNHLKQESNDLQKDIHTQRSLIDEYNEKLIKAQNKYREEFNKQNDDLNGYFNEQRKTRQNQLDEEFERLWHEKEENLKNKYTKFEQEELEKEHKFTQEVADVIETAQKNQDTILADTLYQQQRFDALLAPLQQYEKDKQEKLFYTIQVPDEYKDDIDFLLTTVSQKVQHPDIINKLVWAEYVKPYLDETFKRVGIEAAPGIYKLTNLDSGKAYIGKSTDIKKRISDHFKASIGIKSIADQAVHHAILKSGFWNWSIEYIIYCDKDKLNEMEKYYIDFFKTQDYGYNKNVGGGG